MSIISVCHGYDKNLEPACDTIGDETSVFTRIKGQMHTRTGQLCEIIQTRNDKFLGIVRIENPQFNRWDEFKGFLAKANQVTYTIEEVE